MDLSRLFSLWDITLISWRLLSFLRGANALRCSLDSSLRLTQHNGDALLFLQASNILVVQIKVKSWNYICIYTNMSL